MNIRKAIIKFTAAAMAVIMTVSLTGCSTSFLGNTKKFSCDLLWEKGKISARPTEAYYDDKGQLILVVGVTNSTEYSKIVHEISIDSLKDVKGRELVESAEFELDEPFTLSPGKSSLVQCDFEVEKVKLKAGLSTLDSEITVSYYGCVKGAAEPAKSDKEGFAMTITDAAFVDTGAIEGKIAIRNNYKTGRVPQTISFSIKSGNDVITKENIVITNALTVKPGEVLSIAFTVTPTNIKDSFASSRAFDTLEPVYTIK